MIRTEVIERLKSTYIAKNHDYGNSAHVSFVEFGEVALVIRIADKLSRLQTLLSGEKAQVNDESVADTIGDAITYLCMLAAELDTERDDISAEENMARTDNIPVVLEWLDELGTYCYTPRADDSPESFRTSLLSLYKFRGKSSVKYFVFASVLLGYYLRVVNADASPEKGGD